MAIAGGDVLGADGFTVEQKSDKVIVQHNGKLVTEYLIKSGAKPILWPLVGPGGKEMTRAYPMREEDPTEKHDHIHHRSFWFTHGEVNGVSFWHENDKHGNTIHREFKKVAGGETAVIETLNDWIGHDDEKLLTDIRTITFGKRGEATWIDFDITLTAQTDVTFGDTKEGTFGVRVPGTMKTDAKKGGVLINSHGDTNGDAWGKASPWVDYSGPVKGETLGVSIFNHPKSFRYPTHWHVRTYGLFAANPFGLKAFTKGKEDGELKLAKGESVTFNYRVLLHKGDAKAGEVAEAFEEYSKMAK